jgi:hypothetical protein
LDERKNLLGKYALITDDPGLDAASMMRIYKTTSVIEQEFHVLKSELAIGPFFHRKPERIHVHFALILWGMMALSMLKHELAMKGMEYTFEQIEKIIKGGHVSVGDYLYPGEKSFQIRKTLNMSKELNDIFRVLKIRWEYFYIEEVLTTESVHDGSTMMMIE